MMNKIEWTAPRRNAHHIHRTSHVRRSGGARLLPSRFPVYRFRAYSATGGRHTECACYS